jgi:hypothetical protein
MVRQWAPGACTGSRSKPGPACGKRLDLRERALLLALDRGRKRVGGLVDIFRRRKDLLDRALAT